MSKKKTKLDKETRQLLESISDLVKKKGNGQYKFKSKSKKAVKKVKRSCVHWVYRKGKPVPAVIQDPDHPGEWRCRICGATFPIKPLDPIDGRSAYNVETKKMLELVDQIAFWSVKLGGDADDTRMFLKLKELLPRFSKVSKQVVKQVNKREQMANSSKTNSMDQFNAYSSFSYR